MTKKYAKIVNEDTKQCEVGLGTNVDFYKKMGMTELDVEQGYDCGWYLKGYAPQKPLEELKAEKIAELKNNKENYKINNGYSNDYIVQNMLFGLGTYSEEERNRCGLFMNGLINKYDLKKEAIKNATLETINNISTTFED